MYFKGEARCAVGVVLDHLGVTAQDMQKVVPGLSVTALNVSQVDTILVHMGPKFKDHLAPEVSELFLTELQGRHDSVAKKGGDSIAIVAQLQIFAKNWKLTIPYTEEMVEATVDLRELCLV